MVRRVPLVYSGAVIGSARIAIEVLIENYLEIDCPLVAVKPTQPVRDTESSCSTPRRSSSNSLDRPTPNRPRTCRCDRQNRRPDCGRTRQARHRSRTRRRGRGSRLRRGDTVRERKRPRGACSGKTRPRATRTGLPISSSLQRGHYVTRGTHITHQAGSEQLNHGLLSPAVDSRPMAPSFSES